MNYSLRAERREQRINITLMAQIGFNKTDFPVGQLLDSVERFAGSV